MSKSDRNTPRREVLLDVLDEPFTSIDTLINGCHRALSSLLWSTSHWSVGGTGWKVGDYRFLILSVSPDPDTSLYVQFWSEPLEPVLVEVGSGELCPGAIRYIGPAQRTALEARGFTLGGRANNYGTEIAIGTSATAESAALEALRILFDVFGYRGEWRLEVEQGSGERAERAPVYNSLTPEDFAKVAARVGCGARISRTSDDSASVALTYGRRAFLARLDGRVPENNLFGMITLQADVAFGRPVSDDALNDVNARMPRVKIWRTGSHTVQLQLSLSLDGGVSATWLSRAMGHFVGTWRACERHIRRRAVRIRQRVPRAELVQ